jgi:hypothetical protein
MYREQPPDMGLAGLRLGLLCALLGTLFGLLGITGFVGTWAFALHIFIINVKSFLDLVTESSIVVNPKVKLVSDLENGSFEHEKLTGQ